MVDNSVAAHPDWLTAAREQWLWRGQARPPFAVTPGPGQVSVWDFPRPPRLVVDTRDVVVLWGDQEIARTRRAVLALETAHPPTFYLPWDDVARDRFVPAPGESFCEWKGPARYWSLVDAHDASRVLSRVGWSYPQPFAGAEQIEGCLALYPHVLRCSVGGAVVRPQGGGFYGGWITPELVGPFKGDAGSEEW